MIIWKNKFLLKTAKFWKKTAKFWKKLQNFEKKLENYGKTTKKTMKKWKIKTAKQSSGGKDKRFEGTQGEGEVCPLAAE